MRIFIWYLRPNFIFNFTKYAKHQREFLKVMHDFTFEVIKKRRELILKNQNDENSSSIKKLSFLDILIQSTIDGKQLSASDIEDEVNSFMAASYDTSKSLLGFCLYNLAKFPQIQQKTFEEIKNVIGDLKTPLTIQTLNKLYYLEMVIKETLRLYPSFPFFGRKSHENLEIGEQNNFLDFLIFNFKTQMVT